MKNEAEAGVAAVAQRIHEVLPQTQCRRCGQPDCAAYAQAVAQGDAPINQCPPGGREGIVRIARALEQPERAHGLEIDPACGSEGPMTVAVIDENWCIGCTLCIRACSTDAIVGGHKRMHTVLPAYCTGCELCLLACPVDCIAMEVVDNGGAGDTVPIGWAAWLQQQADQALQRYNQRQLRLQKNKNGRAADTSGQGSDEPETAAGGHGQNAATDAPSEVPAASAEQDRKRAMIEAALARARRNRQMPV